jgi:hypothetical protein
MKQSTKEEVSLVVGTVKRQYTWLTFVDKKQKFLTFSKKMMSSAIWWLVQNVIRTIKFHCLCCESRQTLLSNISHFVTFDNGCPCYNCSSYRSSVLTSTCCLLSCWDSGTFLAQYHSHNPWMVARFVSEHPIRFFMLSALHWNLYDHVMRLF